MEKYTIGGLRKLLTTSKNFSEIQDYFFCIAENNRAAFEGNRGKNKQLKEFCHLILKAGTGREDVIITNLSMIEVRQRCFWHGAGFTNLKGVHFSFCYFSDLDKGLICITRTSGETTFARITVEAVKGTTAKDDYFSMN